MAQIKMDVSEYEAMKKVERLLEESLKTEKELQKKVETLQSEKIKALEDAERKVIVTNRTKVQGYVYSEVDLKYMYNGEILDSLQRAGFSGYFPTKEQLYVLRDLLFKKKRLMKRSLYQQQL